MKVLAAFLLCCLIVVPPANVGAAQAAATCDDFKIQSIAQIRLTKENAKQLDPDGDGVACEELPGGSSASSRSDSKESEPAAKRSSSTSDKLTRQEQTYFDELTKQSTLFSATSQELGKRFGEFADEPALLFDQEWRYQTGGYLGVWKAIGEEAQNLNPSDRQQHIQDLWIEVHRLITKAADEFITGFDSIDPASLEQGTARITYATLLLNDLSKAIDEFKDDPNDPVEPEHVIAPVTECDEFKDYEDAQLFYAANPEEQETIDPDFDGLACEVFFEEE